MAHGRFVDVCCKHNEYFWYNSLTETQMDIASEILNKYELLFRGLPPRGSGRLRLGRSLVSISTIASQYYCEKKLELQDKYPMPPTRRMLDGESGHEATIALATPVSREEGTRQAVAAREKPLLLYEFDIGWKYRGVPIIGKVDEAWLREGDVSLVVERKFSDSPGIYRSYHIQAQLYCLGLGEMGFDNSATQYRIVVFKRSCFVCESLIDNSCPIFYPDRDWFRCGKGSARASLSLFSKEETVSELDWALAYWLREREAVASSNPAKCKVCDWSEVCDSSVLKRQAN